MIIRVNEFAANITRHQGLPAALIIGLDGGASLLNHARPLRIRDALLGDSIAAASAAFNQHYIQHAYLNLGRDGRYAFMEASTAPGDFGVPDGRAIDCIAQMIDSRHLETIIATDTSQVLFEELRARGIKMNWIDAPGVLSSTLASRKGKRMFVDGGDLLLKGLYPNMYDVLQPEIQLAQRGLAGFLEFYQYIYCWGWCDFNVDIGRVCPERGAPAFTALGRYTSAYISFPDIDIVSCAADSDSSASNEIIYELATCLFQNGSPKVVVRAASLARRQLADPAAQEIPRVLLTEAAKSELTDQVGRAAVSFIGIEGELTRERCSLWLTASWRALGRQPLDFASDNVGSLVCWVSFTDDTRNPAWLVGRLIGDMTGGSGWESVLLPHVRRWLDPDRMEDSRQETDRHIVLFVPPGIAQWAARAFEQRYSIWIQCYFETAFLVEGVVVEWLIKYVEPLLHGGLDHGLRPLARHIVESGHHPGQADWLHGALDSWYRDILAEEGRRAESVIDDGSGSDAAGLGLADLFALWDQLCDRCERADGLTGIAFDINLVESQEKESASIPSREVSDIPFSIDARPRAAARAEPTAAVTPAGPEQGPADPPDGAEPAEGEQDEPAEGEEG